MKIKNDFKFLDDAIDALHKIRLFKNDHKLVVRRRNGRYVIGHPNAEIYINDSEVNAAIGSKGVNKNGK